MRFGWLLALAAPGVAHAADGEAGALSLLAPVAAIALALLTRRVLLALGAGAVVGSLVGAGGDVAAAVTALAVTVRDVVWNADHLTITAFSVLVAGMVGVMGRSGGTAALVRSAERYARGPRGAMVSSWLAGALVFFDDYANCLVVGSSMGPLCDRNGVSRAKLAYIVDSTAAPIASVALVSTWIGYEVGLIGDALAAAGSTESGFGVFVASIPHRFYSLFTLVFVGCIAWFARDFGPMWDAEHAARRAPRSDVEAPTHSAARAWLAAVPVVSLVVVTLALLVIDGRAALGDAAASAAFFEILGSADAYRAMLLGSVVAFALAAVLAVGSRALAASALPSASWEGVRPVLEALAVLYLAWTLSDVVTATGASDFLASALEGTLPAWLLPSAAFLLASVTAFATGTSYGTMGILIPLVVPLALTVGQGAEHILYGSTAAILAGACLGDHASPISDTTVLSAIGAGTDVITHVRTQLPYALTTGAISVFAGHLPAGFGYSPWLFVGIGSLACVVIVRFVGRPTAVEAPAVEAAA